MARQFDKAIVALTSEGFSGEFAERRLDERERSQIFGADGAEQDQKIQRQLMNVQPFVIEAVVTAAN